MEYLYVNGIGNIGTDFLRNDPETSPILDSLGFNFKPGEIISVGDQIETPEELEKIANQFGRILRENEFFHALSWAKRNSQELYLSLNQKAEELLKSSGINEKYCTYVGNGRFSEVSSDDFATLCPAYAGIKARIVK